jgi:8-oxo-dGTP diphosphatase
MINGTMCFLRKGLQTLFIHRTKGEGDIHHGWHVPPGGHTEPGERGADCISREFKEETGLELINPRLRVIATFYNQGRILGGKENPEDWNVEVYEANAFTGSLREEHTKAKPIWINDSELACLKMYPGDKKIYSLMQREGVYEAVLQYSGEDLVRFDYKRVY